jgi:ATP-binding cassette subfamily B protein
VVAGLGDLFTLVAISVMMLVVDWRLALASFAVIPFVYLVSHLFRMRVRDAYREIRTRLARINAFLQERVAGMRVVQLFGRERSEYERFDALNRDHLQSHLKSITIYALYFPVIEVLTSIALASLIVASARRVEVDTLSVGTVAAFLQLVRRFFQPLQDLSDKFNTLQQAMASSERVFKLLDTETGGEPAPAGSAAPAPARSAGVTVEFEDVWFHYGDAPADGAEPDWVLKGVSFVVRPGETVALVGHTGAGKTTVVNLLMRFYDPQRGRILVNGADVRGLPLDELRALIAYVQQDIFLFAGDVLGNIRLSNPLTEAEVVAAAERVGADRVIRRLPAWLRPGARRARRLDLGRRAPAPGLRPGDRRRPGAPHPGRGHERRRQRGRGRDPARARHPHARTDDDRRGPPPQHDRERRRDPGDASRPGAGARHPP